MRNLKNVRLVGESKEQFQHIVKVLCNYYSLHSAKKEQQTKSFLFRKQVSEINLNELTVNIKRLSDFEYLITCKIKGIKEPESWIHVDGIEQERFELMNKGVTDSPIFNVISMTDIYRKSSIPAMKKPVKDKLEKTG